jgi:hypothetical protein
MLLTNSDRGIGRSRGGAYQQARDIQHRCFTQVHTVDSLYPNVYDPSQ